MEIHNAEFLINQYNQYKEKEQRETERIFKALYRDKMRKIEKILLEKYKITLDKRH